MSDQNTGGNTPGAPGANGAAAAPPPGAPAGGNITPAEWTSDLDDGLKGYVQNKGFKSPKDVIESYRNFEKLRGVPQERLLALPENMNLSTPEGRAVFERLGAPKEAKDYKIEIPKENGDTKLADWFRDVAYKNGMTHEQVAGLVGAWNESRSNAQKSMVEALTLKSQEQEANLKKEWGGAFDQNLNIAKAGAKAFGITDQQMDALEDSLGYDGALKLLHKFGVSTGEHQFHAGQPPKGGILTPLQARQKIQELSADAGFYNRLKTGDVAAKQEWERLNKMAVQSN